MSRYDNTDERGEDAVARQRGGSERPQHVDTCRVCNCYGCEEIVDEPVHLPECWLAPGACLAPGPHQEVDGFCWKCHSHCICDRLRACEQRVRSETGQHVTGSAITEQDLNDHALNFVPVHVDGCPCNNADERGCFLISADTGKCVSCECDALRGRQQAVDELINGLIDGGMDY